MVKVNATMSTEIALNTIQASDSLKRITQLVNSATSAWKAQESQLRTTGDYLGAAQAKYDGLGNAIQHQQEKIEKLRKEQSELKGNTVETAEQYLKYQQQIDQATTKLSSLEVQQQKAKSSMDYYKSGLGDLQKEYKQQVDLSETYINRLKAEGKQSEAKQEKLKLLKSSINNLNKQYEVQENMLKKVAKNSGNTSNEYKLQKKRLDETATSIAKAKSSMDKLNAEIKESHKSSSLVGQLKNSFTKLNNKVDETEHKTSRLKGIFSATFAANIISNGFQNILGSIRGKIDDLISSSSEYVKYQQTMNATWLTLTGNVKEGQKMVDITNQMAQAAANSTEMVDGMNQKFYAVTHNVELTKQQTQAILTLQDAFGQTDAAVENFSTQWAQMIANGKVQGQDMMSIINVFPEMKNQLKEVAGQELGIANITQEQYAKLQSDGKITAEMAQKALFELQDKYKDATANFSTTIGGLERTIQSRMPAVVAAFRGPIDKMKNPFLQQIGNWVADPNTEGKFKELGEHVSKGLGTIMDAFSKVFNLGNGTDKLNGFMDSLNKLVDKLSKSIAKNAPKIVAFFKEAKDSLIALFSIGKDFAGGVWETAVAMIKGVAGALGTMAGNGKKAKVPVTSLSKALGSIAQHKTAIKTVGSLFAMYFVGSKVASGVMKVAQAINFMKKSTLAMTVAQKAAAAAQKVAMGVQWALNAAMSANPIGATVVAIAALIAGFVMLYKHNKKFKKFVDGIAKSVKNGIGVAIKWLKNKFSGLSKGWKNFIKAIKNGAKKVVGFFVNVGKIIKKVMTTIGKILIFTNPVVLGFALMYKQSPKFRKFIKNIVGFVGDMKNGISKKTKQIGKDWSKHWTDVKKSASKTWNKINNNTKKSTDKLAKEIRKKQEDIHNKWNKSWKSLRDYLSDRWDDMNELTKKKFGKDIKGLLFENLDKIGNKFQDTWNKIKKGFSELWSGLKRLAGDGINAVIKIPNAGIDGINSLISDFGGSNNAIKHIPKVKFASGTGFTDSIRRPITRPTLALLNDGNDSPETDNREALIHPNGQLEVLNGRNINRILMPGTEVLNATELKMLASMQSIPFAKGTGFWSRLWDSTTSVAGNVWDGIKDTAEKFTKMLSFIGDAVKDPVGTLSKKFNPNANKLAAVFNPLGNALFKTPIKESKNWWKELWSMAQSATDEGTVAMGAVGDDYRFKNMAKDAGADPWGYYFRECVSFVASRLANLGVNPALFSHLGNGNQWVNARVPHLSTPKPGTVAVYTGSPTSSNHVDFVTAVHGNTYDGEEYNFNNNGLYHQYSRRPVSHAATFLDFGVRAGNSEDSKPLKDKNSPLQKLIKGQVGGMFDWIKKNLGPLLNPAGGEESNIQGTGAARWRNTVIKALKANGIEPTDFRISKILATIQRESNGDPNAQNNWDSNAMAGHPSIGLMQTIGPTFEAYKLSGHNNIRNGYDNLLAAINYIKHRYGTSDAAFNRVASYGYANGGLVSKHGVYELAEGNMPEYVIPTDTAKRGRAWTLLAEVVGQFVGEEKSKIKGTSSSESESVLAKN